MSDLSPASLVHHRRVVAARGDARETRRAAAHIIQDLPEDRVLWVGASAGEVHPQRLASLLGQGFDAVVLDLHEGLNADALGICHGLVWGGGCLILRMPLFGAPPRAPALVVWPHTLSAVGDRLWCHLESCLARAEPGDVNARQEAVDRRVTGTQEQRDAIEKMVAFLGVEEPGIIVLLADRGRGKSSALGLAARRLLEEGHKVIVCAEHEAMATEVMRHAGPMLRFVAPTELASVSYGEGIVLVDEAAVIPIPLLQQMVARQPRARFAMASTTHGYEGTGRGFVLRFLSWVKALLQRWCTLTLREPIRWGQGDLLERFVFDVLLLDAVPVRAPSVPALCEGPIDRATLQRDERSLRELFGLLVAAHYRTTPSDLHRLLDAPNLSVYLARDPLGHIIAATLLAREGGLPAEICEGLARGAHRIRAHALPETLVVHAGREEAGALAMIRSVRIAVHPDLRRRHVAWDLVEHVHEREAEGIDLFGTIFGATPELLRFRRMLGYELVRVGSSRGARSGEPGAVMIRPVSLRARELLSELRSDLARALPLQLDLMASDGGFPLESSLVSALMQDLPLVRPLPEGQLRGIVSGYTEGPRPYDVVAAAVAAYVSQHSDRLGDLDAAQQRIIELRVLERRSWVETAGRCGYQTVPSAMRALRRAVAQLQAHVDIDGRGMVRPSTP